MEPEPATNAGTGNIVLIGMRASGKTTLGRELAARLALPFLDLDEELGRRAAASADALLASAGEAAFRALEEQVLLEASRRSGHVIATGGGAVLHPRAFAALAATGTVAYLRASLATLQQRSARRPRPALTGFSLEQEVAELLAQRAPLYERAAGIVVPTDEGDPILALFTAFRDRK